MWKETWMIMIIASIIIPFCTITCHRGFHSFLLYSDISLIIFYANDTSAFFFTHFIHLSLALQLAMVNQVTFLRNYLTPLPFRVSIFSLSFFPLFGDLLQATTSSSFYLPSHPHPINWYINYRRHLIFPLKQKHSHFPLSVYHFPVRRGMKKDGWMNEWEKRKERKGAKKGTKLVE